MMILRHKKEGTDEKTIQAYLIGSGYYLKTEQLHKLIRAKGMDDVVRFLMGTPYTKLVADTIAKDPHLVETETALTHYLFERSISVFHRGLLSPNVIIGYLFMKENEVRNLRLLIKGKQLGVENSFIEKQLVYA